MDSFVTPVGLVEIPGEVQVREYRFSVSKGAGKLSGSYPDGAATIDGVPTRADIRVLLRTEIGHVNDGALVAETTSADDGTWQVVGLPLGLKYDVVGRKDGFNDVIMANVSPAVE